MTFLQKIFGINDNEDEDVEHLCEERLKHYKERLQNSDKTTLPVFEMPYVEKWGVSSTQLRAFLDRDQELYVNELPSFEYRLLEQLQEDPKKYRLLIDLYRERYFSYHKRLYDARFYLEHYQERQTVSFYVQEALLKDEKNAQTTMYNYFQQTVNSFYETNREAKDFANLRFQENALLLDLQQRRLEFIDLLQQKSRALSKLLTSREPITVTEPPLALTTYFQNKYDLINKEDLQQYLQTLSTHDTQQTDSDIARIRDLIQQKIIDNNIEAEEKLTHDDAANLGTILMDYAAKEQQWITHYRSLLTLYFAHISQLADFALLYKPFELYFDNYFADFDNILKYYVHLYKDQHINALQTPYYNKIYTATKTKITVTNTNFTQEIESYKKHYISSRDALTELTQLKREYEQEIDSLIDEFRRYGALYVSALSRDETLLSEHLDQVKTLQEQYDLRMNNEFF